GRGLDRDQRGRTQRSAAATASVPVRGRTARQGATRRPEGRLDRRSIQRLRDRLEQRQGRGGQRATVTQGPRRAAVEGPRRPGDRGCRLVRRDVQLLQVSGHVRRRRHELLPQFGGQLQDRQGTYG